MSSRTPEPLAFVGSVTWRATSPFGRADHAELVHHRVRTPGTTRARLVGVSRTGFDPPGLVDVELGPDELLAAWRP